MACRRPGPRAKRLAVRLSLICCIHAFADDYKSRMSVDMDICDIPSGCCGQLGARRHAASPRKQYHPGRCRNVAKGCTAAACRVVSSIEPNTHNPCSYLGDRPAAPFGRALHLASGSTERCSKLWNEKLCSEVGDGIQPAGVSGSTEQQSFKQHKSSTYCKGESHTSPRSSFRCSCSSMCGASPP